VWGELGYQVLGDLPFSAAGCPRLDIFQVFSSRGWLADRGGPGGIHRWRGIFRIPPFVHPGQDQAPSFAMLWGIVRKVELHRFHEVWQAGQVRQELCQVRGSLVPEARDDFNQDLRWADIGEELDKGAVEVSSVRAPSPVSRGRRTLTWNAYGPYVHPAQLGPEGFVGDVPTDVLAGGPVLRPPRFDVRTSGTVMVHSEGRAKGNLGRCCREGGKRSATEFRDFYPTF
jgi:hypothetical protein